MTSPSMPELLDEAFVRRLERLALQTRHRGVVLGERPGPRRVPAADLVDRRPYSPGDDLRHIDWAAVARLDVATIKIGAAPDAADVRLLLDRSPSMTSAPEKWRSALRLAAALGWIALARGDRWSAMVFPGEARRSWGPASGAARAPEWLRFLSTLPGAQAPDGNHDLSATAGGWVRAAPGGGLLLILSDLWRCEDLGGALQAAPSPRWDKVVLQLLDRAEVEPPDWGAVELEDRETGERLSLVVDGALRTAYTRALDQRQERIRALCAAHGAAWRPLRADWPLERNVVPLLAHGGLIGRRHA